MLLARLHTTERQLLATFRDEASTDLIRVGSCVVGGGEGYGGVALGAAGDVWAGV